MSQDEYHYPNSIKSLDVSSNPAPRKLNERTPIDELLDASKTDEQKSLEQKVVDVIKTIYDPEIPVNIYELGLIYDIAISDDNKVKVKMTLTAPGCPVAGTLPGEVASKIQQLPEVTSADVELVWDPPWDKSRMSETALLELGLL
ncbi:MAG TPA: SUF system Fe-S cluster assembly protein [Tepidisphaeraceae bacterium]|jgi:FeS assembly SUF system protein